VHEYLRGQGNILKNDWENVREERSDKGKWICGRNWFLRFQACVCHNGEKLVANNVNYLFM